MRKIGLLVGTLALIFQLPANAFRRPPHDPRYYQIIEVNLLDNVPVLLSLQHCFYRVENENDVWFDFAGRPVPRVVRTDFRSELFSLSLSQDDWIMDLIAHERIYDDMSRFY